MPVTADPSEPTGTVEPDFEPVREVFQDVLAQHEAAGATGCGGRRWRNGRWVVDLWGGYADAARTTPWRRDTLVMPYSVTKPFAAVCALVLAERCLIDLDAPLSTYWRPELTAQTTMRQVLCHSSGLALLETPAPEEAFYDWDLANPPGALDPAVVNGARWRVAEVPAVNGHGTARGVAALLVAIEEGCLLSEATRCAMSWVAAAGKDQVLGQEVVWAWASASTRTATGWAVSVAASPGAAPRATTCWASSPDGSPTTTGRPASTTRSVAAWACLLCDRAASQARGGGQGPGRPATRMSPRP